MRVNGGLLVDNDVTLTKAASPVMVMITTGLVLKSRVFQADGNDLWLSRNYSYSAGAWNLDDTAKTGSFLGLDSTGGLAYYTGAAAANPAPYVNRFGVQLSGNALLPTGSLTIGGSGTGTSGATLGAGNISGRFTGRLIIEQGQSYYGVEIVGSSALSYKHACLLFNETGMPVDQRKWRLYAYNNAFSIERLNDAESAVTVTGISFTQAGAATIPNGLTVSGALSATGALTVAGTLSTTGEIDAKGGSGTSYATAPIEVMMASYPRIGFHWPAVVASQIGMDSAGTIRTFDNPGTGYAHFCAGNIQSINNTWVSNIHPTGYVYPGRMTETPGIQSGWYLAGHSSYGIYCNTGLYLAGGMWTASHVSCNYVEASAHIRAAAGLYDYARGTPIGDWVNNPGYWGGYFQNGFFYYSLVGHTLHIHAYAYLWTGGAPATIAFSHPFVSSVAGQIAVACNSGGSWQGGFVTTSAGGSSLVFQRYGGALTSGTYIGLNCAIAVN